ncbi:MAG: hypothetical protein LUC19_04190 [Oscillospiraceae bacterium]|nr:hypothetical protein [Oscillospiraceae bacterium]
MVRRCDKRVRGSAGRLAAIAAVTALAAALLAGFAALGPAMDRALDDYAAETALYDLKATSSLGFEPNAAETIAQLDGVSAAEGAFYAEAAALYSGGEADFTFRSLTSGTTRVALTAGAMPQNSGECLADANAFTESDIGSIIRLSDSNSADILSLFQCAEYTITGLCTSPEYISSERGSAGAFVYIPRESFAADICTEIYISLTGSEDTQEADYSALVSSAAAEIEPLTVELAAERCENAAAEAREKADTAAPDYAAALDEYEELSAALEQLKADTQADLDAAWQSIADEEYVLGVAWDAYRSRLEALTDLEETSAAAAEETAAELAETLTDLEQRETEYTAALADYESALADYNSSLNEYTAARDAWDAELAAALAALEAGEIDNSQFTSLQSTLNTSAAELNAADAELTAEGERLEAIKTQLESERTALDSERADYNAAAADLEASRAEAQTLLEQSRMELNAERARLVSAEAELDAGKTEYYAAEAETAERVDEAEIALANAETELKAAQESLAAAEAALEALAAPTVQLLGRSSNAGYIAYKAETDAVRGIAAAFAIIFFVLAVFVCLTFLMEDIKSFRFRLGVLTALGSSGSTAAWRRILCAIGACAAGCVCGCALGLWLVPTLARSVCRAEYAFAGAISPRGVPLFALFACALYLLAALSAAVSLYRKELSATPAELMQPRVAARSSRSIETGSNGAFLLTLAVRSVLHRPAVMLIGVGGAAALISAGCSLRRSAENIAALNVVAMAIIAFSAALALAVIFTSAALSMPRYGRELAAARALGLSDMQSFAWLCGADYIQTAAGAVIGLPVGALLYRLVPLAFGQSVALTSTSAAADCLSAAVLILIADFAAAFAAFRRTRRAGIVPQLEAADFPACN